MAEAEVVAGSLVALVGEGGAEDEIVSLGRVVTVPVQPSPGLPTTRP